MKLQAKIWLGSGVVIAMIMAVDLIYGYRAIQADIRQQLDNDARIVQALLMSTRRVYHQQFLASGLEVNERTLGFLPAHALARISDDFPNWLKTGLRFNNVSDRPRSPSNQADADELVAINWFRANPDAPDRVSEIKDRAGNSYYHFTAPMWTEAYCLKCHGAQGDAPPSIRDTYSQAYGYQVGELRGILSVKVPMHELQSHAMTHWLQMTGARLLGYLALLLLLGSLMQRLVTRRLAKVEATALALQHGDLSARVDVSGNDEVSQLGRGFNTMAQAMSVHNVEIDRLNHMYAALSRTNQTIVSVHDETELLNRVCQIAVEHGQFGLAWVGRVNPQSQAFEVVSAFGSGVDFLQGIQISADAASPYGNGLCGSAWRSGQAMVVNDYFTDPITTPWQAAVRRFGWSSNAAFPVFRGGRIHLLLSLYHPEKAVFDTQMFNLLSEMAMDIGYALDRMDLVGQQKLTLATLRESEAKYRTVIQTSQDGFWLVSRDGHLLEVNDAYVTFSGYSREQLLHMHIADLDANVSAQDVTQRIEAIMAKGTDLFETAHRTQSGDLKPVEISTSFSTDQSGFLSVFIRDLTKRQEAESRIQKLSYFDALTGLANRAQFVDHARLEVKRAQDQGQPLAVICLDLDHFGQINDSFGHHAGDLFLVHLSERFKSVLTATDSLCRSGSDEFLFLVTHADAPVVQDVIQRLLDAVTEPVRIEGHAISTTISLGIARYPEDGLSVEDLLRAADTATHWTKKQGRNAYSFFTAEMRTAVTAHVKLEADLREAVSQHQFVLHYQAQIAQNRLSGAEVLVRWRHPQRGMVSPAEFIPLAEENGLILPLGSWVLETACLQLTRWAAQPAFAALTLAVNVSAKQFHTPDFVEQVLQVLARTGANPARLKLELTESMLVDDVEQVTLKMGRLKDKGVSFSLDDFGTGYSSLAYLKRLPLDQLKIDQGFVRNIATDANDAAIAKMVVALADSMGLSVIAEGVESEEQRDFLASVGCLGYQGYLFSRPLPLQEFEAFVRAMDSPAA